MPARSRNNPKKDMRRGGNAPARRRPQGLRGKTASGTANVGKRPERQAPKRKPQSRPARQPGTVFDRVGQQSGPVSKASAAPGRAPRRTAPPKTRDAPQTRKQDMRRAAAYNRSERGKASRQVARDAREKQALRAALKTVEQASRRQARAPGPSITARAGGAAGTVVRTADRELSGRGSVIPATQKAAAWLARQATADPLNLTGDKAGVGISKDIRGTKLAGRGAEDVFNLAPSAISGPYVYGKAAAKAVTGDTKPAKEVIEGIKRDDPLYAAATGDFKRALKLANKHPGFAAVELYGAGRSLDLAGGASVRGAGRVVKGIGKATRSKGTVARGEKIRRKAATETRQDSVTPETGARTFRQWDRGTVTQTVQKRRERQKIREADALRQRAANLEKPHDGRPTEMSARLRAEAAKKDPRVMRPSDRKRRENIREAASESYRRRRMAEADREFADVVGYGPVGRRARNAVAKARRRPATARPRMDQGASFNLTAQGIAKADAKDLLAYKKQLKAAYEKIELPEKRAANERLRALIDESLQREQKKPGTLKQSGERAKQYAREISKPLDEDLTREGLLERARGEKAILNTYAARRMGAYLDDEHYVDVKTGKRLTVKQARKAIRKTPPREARQRYKRVRERWVDRDGKQLTDSAIKRHMADNGMDPDDLAFISQSPKATGAGAYYQSSYQEPRYAGKARSEKSTVEGTFEGTVEAARARVTRGTNAVSTSRNYRQSLSENAVRDQKSGRVRAFATPDRAERVRQAVQDRTGVKMRVVRASPWGVSKKQLAKMVDDASENVDPRSLKKQGDGAPASFSDQIKSALDGEGEGPFVIIPDEVATNMMEQRSVLGPTDAGKIAQAARSAFSRTVLSTSLSPTAGNLIEGLGRAAVSRSGPTAYITYRRVLKKLREIDPEAARRFEDNTIGTGRVTLQGQTRHMEPGQFAPGRLQDAVAKTAAFWEGKKGPKGARELPKLASEAWQAWTGLVFDVVNGKMIERPLQKAMAGRSIRRSGLMNDGMLNNSAKAIEQAAQGLRGTAEQVQVAKDLFDMYGRYRAFPPSVRATIANYTPFLAWYGNSAIFVGKVLPRDHPLLLAVMASSAQVTNDVDIQKNRPGWLKGTMNAGGVQWQVTRNTPFGAFTDPWGTAGSTILPQLSPVFAAKQGEDWKGKKLRNPDGTPFTQAQLSGYVITEMLASMVPAYAVYDRGKAYIEKPGRLLNPVRVNTKSSDGEPGVKRPASKTRSPLQAQVDAFRNQSKQDARKVLDAQIKAFREQQGVK